jgi:hypothetical protein
MAYSQAIRLLAEEIRSLGFASIGAAYMGVGTALDHPARVIIVQNYTDTQLMFSLDGVTDNFTLIANDRLILDIAANKTREQGFYLAEGDRLYVKEVVTPTSGSVYLSVLYGRE